MANTIGYGQGAVNNTNAWGQGAKVGSPSFSNTQSIELDGIDDYVDCGSSSYLQNLTEFSVSLWAKQPTATSTQCLIGDWNFNTQGNIALETGTVSGGATKLTFYIRELSGTIRTTTTQNYVFTQNVWNHIAVTFNSGTLNIYVNGTAQGLNLPSLPSSLSHNDGTLDIGYFEGLGRNFAGYIDEVAVFNSELSASDVSAIASAPSDLSTYSGLVSWYRFEGTGTTATDSGSGGNNGTLTNGATRSTDVPT